ncbi:Tom37 C-terminal domain-containing protein [Podospora australis]|uniref:Tom37 C-terminal domain-containing protein n=1 Tax=Podospora australis TaxID=1536484 RepID=A0AAN7AMU6_9PEZI|nr:Tom37 C-terminal domain-containing protein [Podospora australis]
MAPLQLYVWGPAFGLPSIDAECNAAIAYLAQTTSKADFQLIQSSPSAVPTHHLPALHDPVTATWSSGFSSIVRHLQSHPPPSFHDHSLPASSSRALADNTAYTTFLAAHGTPLIALSFYVSSANWTATTRPAYSKILPFPLPWTEVSGIRTHMAERAEHLGMSSLDTDAEAEKERQEEEAAANAGWITVPAALRRGPRTVGEVLVPEQKRRIKLEGLVKDVLDVVAEVNLSEASEGTPTTLKCVVYGYLSLMLVEEVPRAWLSEVVRQKYPSLTKFVGEFGRQVGEVESLPWVEEHESNQALAVQTRFAHGVVHEIPWIGEVWRRWWAGRRMRGAGKTETNSGEGVLLAGGSVVMLAIAAGVFVFKRLPRFGATVQRWEMAPVGFGGLGAAGEFLSNVFVKLE